MTGGIQAFIDTHSAVIGLAILAVMFVEFIRERYAVSVISLLGACAFLALGLLDADGFFSVFSNTAPITVAAMFILSGALVRTGVIDAVASFFVARARRHPRLAVLEVFGGALAVAPFMNNTPVVAILIPIVFRLATATGFAVKKLMMPISIVAVLGGCLTLVGTSTNLVVDGLARDAGMLPFGIFEITPYGAAAVVAGCIGLLVLGPWLLPDDPPSGIMGDTEDGDYLTELTVREDSAFIGKLAGEVGPIKRRMKQVRAIIQGSRTSWTDLETIALGAGDRIVLRAQAADLLTLRQSKDFTVGITRGVLPPEEEQEIVETMIAPTHPSIGGRLADVPFFNRLRVRVLGVMRYRHLPGPDLANARLRAADRLLIAAGPDSVQALRDNQHLLGASPIANRAFRPDLAPIAVLALAAAITVSALGLMPIAVSAVLATAAILLLRCLDPAEAWASIDGDVLILIFAMLAVGLGLEQAGSVRLMVDWITPVLRDASPAMLVFLVYFMTLLLSELLSNNAVAAIVTPVVIYLARDLGVDPRPLVIGVMIAASACFATPIGYQTNVMVYVAGDYRFMDFVKIGVPLNIIVGVAACSAIILI